MRTLKREPNYKELTEIMNEVLRTGETVIIDTARKYTKIYRVEATQYNGGAYVATQSIILRSIQGRKVWFDLGTGECLTTSKKEAKELAGV